MNDKEGNILSFRILIYFQGHLVTEYSELPEKHVHKIFNPWIIKTPPGYSCLFTSPLNNNDDRFNIIPGIVDNDIFDILDFSFFMSFFNSTSYFLTFFLTSFITVFGTTISQPIGLEKLLS